MANRQSGTNKLLIEYEQSEIGKSMNRYLLVKTKVEYLNCDLRFLKRCRKNEIIPKFIQLKSGGERNNRITNKAVFIGLAKCSGYAWKSKIITQNYFG